MINKAFASVAAILLGASVLVACGDNGDNQPYYDTMCVDYYTGVFEPYYYCQPGYGGYGTTYRTYYVHPGFNAPRVGQRVPHFSTRSFSRPKNASIHTGGVPTTGGKAKSKSTKSSTKTKSRKNSGGGSSKKKITRPKTKSRR